MYDSYVDRKGTNAAKIDEAILETGSEDVVSLSVADMDFKASPQIIDALNDKVNHGIYGYTNVSEKFYNVVQKWIEEQYRYNVSKDWIVFMPRIIQAVSLLIQDNSEVNDRVMIQTPLYSPLKNAIESNGRKVIENTLIYEDNYYKMDFEDLENEFKKGIKILILCSPHNPIGRVWDKSEISQLVNLCKKYDVLLISDEVHADFTWDKEFVSVGKFIDVYDNIVICTSPGKTFNLPGVEASNIIIPNSTLRENFESQKQRSGFHNPNYFAETALVTAYNSSEEWLESSLKYIRENYNFAKEYIEHHLSDFKVVDSEGTYLMWIDYTQTELTDEEIYNWLFKESKVAVTMGDSFGVDGKGFFRVNVALSRNKVEEALTRMSKSYKKLNKEN